MSWDMYQERAFMENLFCQRFNFFILTYALIITSSVTVTEQIMSKLILFSGLILCIMMWMTLYRIYVKLDIILIHLHHDKNNDVFTTVDRYIAGLPVYKKLIPMNSLIGIYIPVLGILSLLSMIIIKLR